MIQWWRTKLTLFRCYWWQNYSKYDNQNLENTRKYWNPAISVLSDVFCYYLLLCLILNKIYIGLFQFAFYLLKNISRLWRFKKSVWLCVFAPLSESLNIWKLKLWLRSVSGKKWGEIEKFCVIAPQLEF